MKNIYLLGFFTLIIAFISCAQSSQKEKTELNSKIPEDWKLLEDSDYLIYYPDSFELNKTAQMGMRFILLSKLTSKQDSFRENINLAIQDLMGQNIDLDKYVEISEAQIRKLVTNVNLLESKRLTDRDKEFHQVIFSGKQGQFDLKWEQFWWVENNKAYVLTMTCEIDEYDKFVSVGEKIMKTFKIK